MVVRIYNLSKHIGAKGTNLNCRRLLSNGVLSRLIIVQGVEIFMKEITLQSVVLAYRKAKVDLFYSGLPVKSRIVEFEEDFEQNISRVYDAIKNRDSTMIKSWAKGYFLVPKKLHFKDKQQPKFGVMFSDSSREVNRKNVDKYELRVMVDAPIEFHVVATWWILAVGEKLERYVSKNAYGNRLRRVSRHSGCDGEPSGTTDDGLRVSEYSLGTYCSYLPKYRKWRNEGLKTIRKAIDEKKNVVAVTADFTAFYHNINPSFLTNTEFVEYVMDGGRLDADEEAYTELIVDMLMTWAESTPIKKGLPVGCSVSALIANLALTGFDRRIEKEIVPLYYGRYVDDVILVMENTNRFANAEDVWEWLGRRIADSKRGNALTVGDKEIVYKSVWPLGMELTFEAEKTKVFVIDHESGGLVLDVLDRQIRSRSSEWRALPCLPEDVDEMTAAVLSACNEAGEEVDNLRKVDALRLKRAFFSMKVRDFEAYTRNISPENLGKLRNGFLRVVNRHFTDVKSVFELGNYIPRILAAACSSMVQEDRDTIEFVFSIVKKLIGVVSDVNSSAKVLFAGDDSAMKLTSEQCDALSRYMGMSISENLLSAVSEGFTEIELKSRWRKERSQCVSYMSNVGWHDLLAHDLAFSPFCRRFEEEYGQDDVLDCAAGIKMGKSFFVKGYEAAVGKFCDVILQRPLKGRMPFPLAFPTRPLSLFGITTLPHCQVMDEAKKAIIDDFLAYERGYAKIAGVTANPNQFHVQWSGLKGKIRVALTNWETSNESYKAAVCKVADPNEVVRFNRMMQLVNRILAIGQKVDYVVFPELSIPRKWFESIARKLMKSSISLIAGVEYQAVGRKEDGLVKNEVWCSLMYDGRGFPELFLYRFPKFSAAIHEAEELRRLAKLRMEELPVEERVVRHGMNANDFWFSVLICSDLTDIKLRALLRAKIDALFVPAWNTDGDTFAPLIESAASDLHAYIVECNDRAYGDTRIRAPAKDRHQRDIVKIKGGDIDGFIVGTLDVAALRAFQSNAVSPGGNDVKFKPTPRGFKMTEDRKSLPEP